MNVRASSRFASVLLAAGLAPAAGAMELGQASAPASAASTITLPIFLDAARLVALQDAWRARANPGEAAATRGSPEPGEPEAATIDQARQTLTHGEQVSRQAAAVRDRAEELSRRFADSSDGASTPAPDPSPAPVAPEDATVTETASIEPAPAETAPAEAVPETPVQPQKVSATINVPAVGTPATASMLGGPRVDDTAGADRAPVIEDMATKPFAPTKRAAIIPPPPRRVVQTPPESPGFFASIFPGSSAEEATTPQPDDPDKMMPRELRSFGWNAQP